MSNIIYTISDEVKLLIFILSVNFPPLFTNSLPSDLDIIIGQKVTLTLSAKDIEQQNIQIKVNTNLDPSTYNLGKYYQFLEGNRFLNFN